MIILTVISLTILSVMWFIYGRDEKPVITYEHAPPDNLDPLQIQYILSENEIPSRALYAMLLYWVNKGYLLIIDGERKGVEVKEIIRPDEPPYARRLFRRLFKKRKRLYFDNMPKNWDASSAITTEVRKSLGMKDATAPFIFSYVLYLLMWLMTGQILFPVKSPYYTAPEDAAFPALIMMTCIAIFVILLNLYLTYLESTPNKYLVISGIVIFAGLSSFLLYTGTKGMPVCDVICSFLLLFVGSGLVALMTRHTDGKLYGRILGFREYIKTAEVDKLMVLSKDDPLYGISIIPYAALFGYETEWNEKCQLLIGEKK